MPVFYICEPVDTYLMHVGNTYVWSHVWEDLPVAGVARMAISTGSVPSRKQHFEIAVGATGGARIAFYESARGIFGGTDAAAINLVRPAGEQVVTPTTAVVTFGITYTELGTVLFDGLIPGATVLALGGVEQALPVWHLMDNENYMIVVTNLAAAGIDLSITVTQRIESSHTHATG